MLKSVLSFFAILISTLSVAAQNPGNSPMWGIRAAIDLNIPGKWHGDAGSVEMFRSGFGGTIGTVCNIGLGHNFYLEPGLSLFCDTYSYKDLLLTSEEGDPYQTDPSLWKLGLRVPVMIGYDISIGNGYLLSIFTGPEASYAFAGEVNFKDKELREEFPLLGKSGMLRRIDCAWKIGAGISFDLWMVSLDSAIGITDLLKTGMTFHENRISLGVTRFL